MLSLVITLPMVLLVVAIDRLLGHAMLPSGLRDFYSLVSAVVVVVFWLLTLGWGRR